MRGRYFYRKGSYDQTIHFYEQSSTYGDSVLEYHREDMPPTLFYYVTCDITFNKETGALHFYCAGGNISGYFSQYSPIHVECEWNSDGTLHVDAELANGLSVINGDFIESDLPF